MAIVWRTATDSISLWCLSANQLTALLWRHHSEWALRTVWPSVDISDSSDSIGSWPSGKLPIECQKKKPMAIKKKSQVFGNFLTVKWQFSEGSGSHLLKVTTSGQVLRWVSWEQVVPLSVAKMWRGEGHSLTQRHTLHPGHLWLDDWVRENKQPVRIYEEEDWHCILSKIFFCFFRDFN